MPKPVRLICALILLFLLYISSRDIRTRSERSPSNSRPSQSNTAAAAFLELDSPLSVPLENDDLHGMSRRINLFKALLLGTSSRFPVSFEALVKLFDKAFPWWRVSQSHYTSWASQNGGTGIVISVGSEDVTFAAHLISTLRNVLHSTVPIQIAYAGDSDLSRAAREALRALGPSIETLNLLDHFDNSEADLTNAGFATKPLAMLASRFQKVILVDADSIFLQAPDRLFESDSALQDTGMLFWNDRTYPRRGQFSQRDWVKKLLRGSEPSEVLSSTGFWKYDLGDNMDSGVVCMDKGRSEVLMNLIFTAWMNTKEVREGVIYGHVHGDKETFWLAPELTTTRYSFSPFPASIIGLPSSHLDANAGHFSQTVCSAQLLHFDHHGRPFWLNGSLRRKKLSPTGDMAGMTHWINRVGPSKEGLKWLDQGDGSWCAEGEPVAIGRTPMGDLLELLKRDALAAEERLYEGTAGVLGSGVKSQVPMF